MSKKKAASKKPAPKKAPATKKGSPKPPLSPGIPPENQLKLAEFLQHVQDGHTFADKGKKRPFCFILGAGASVQSGIPTASTFVDDWLPEIHKREASPLELKAWATAENLGIPGFTYSRRSEFYSALFDLRFKGHEEDGILYLQEKMEGVQPSYGYAVLAQLLGGVHRVVITTNFDSLASDAMFLFGGKAPFICGHERMADYIPEHSNRPVIVKIHRDLLTAPINSHAGTGHLEDAWHEPVKRLLQRYNPIFIGYGGNDGSLMQFLADLPKDTPERVYWCHYKPDNLSSKVTSYLTGKNRYLVPIDGFDQLMQEVHGVLGLPDLVKMLEEKNEARLVSLRASLAKLTETTRADVVNAVNSDGQDSPDALAARSKYAMALYDQGKYAIAELEHRTVAQLRARVLGAEHPDTLKSRNNLANALKAQGRYTEAEHEHREVLKIRERVLGAEHLETLSSRNNLANALDYQGRYAEAGQEHREVLQIRERVLGTEHLDTLKSRNNLATALQAQGKHPEAEQEHQAVLHILERVLGAEHPDTLSSRNNLANALQAQGKYAEAEHEHRAVLQFRARVLGAEHPDTLKSRNNMANAVNAQGRYAEAEPEHRAVVQFLERVLGADHPDMVKSCCNLALCLESQQKLPEALGFMQRAEQVGTKALGPGHPDTKAAKTARERIEAKLK